MDRGSGVDGAHPNAIPSGHPWQTATRDDKAAGGNINPLMSTGHGIYAKLPLQISNAIRFEVGWLLTAGRPLA